MNPPGWPIYCAYGAAHAAVYRVESLRREVVTCEAHLARAQKWAGPGSAAIRLPHVTGVDQPAQQTLF